MSDTFQTGKTFVTGEQVTATDLNNAVNQAIPKVALTDDQSITVVNNKLAVKDGSATNGVPLTKLRHIVGHSVIGNTGSATAAPTNIEVAAYEAVLGNSAGNGLITDKIGTDNIKDDAVSQAKTNFINSTTGEQTLTGTSPNLTFNDTNNVVTNKPFINGNTTDGGLHVRAQEANSVIQNLGTSKVLLATSNTPGSDVTDVADYVTRLEVSSTSGKTETGSATAGAKVTGGLYVTGDVYADDEVVADHLLLQGNDPTITFADDDSSGKQNPLITGNSTNGNLAILTKESESELTLECSDNLLLKTTNDPTQDQSGTNDFVERFRASHNAGKNASGTSTAGCKVTGDLDISSDLYVTGEARIGTITSNPIIKNTSPKLTLEDTDNSGTDPYIISDNSGSIGVYSTEANSDVIIDGKDEVRIRHDGTNGIVVAADAGKDASGAASAGAKIEGDLQVTGEANIGKTKLGTDSILAATPSVDDNSTKIATTAYVDRQVDEGTPNNRLRIKLLPADFKRSDFVSSSGAFIDTDSSQSQRFVASYDIPGGYKVTHITASGDDIDFQVFRNELEDSSTGTTEASGQSNAGAFVTVELDNHITGTDTNYCTVKVFDGGGNGRFYGGFLTLAKA